MAKRQLLVCEKSTCRKRKARIPRRIVVQRFACLCGGIGLAFCVALAGRYQLLGFDPLIFAAAISALNSCLYELREWYRLTTQAARTPQKPRRLPSRFHGNKSL